MREPRQPPFSRRLLRWSLTPIITYAMVVVAMCWMEKSLIFFPDSRPLKSWQPAGLDVEEAWFTADDGTRLYGWYLHHPQPRAVVLLAGGNAGNVSYWADLLQQLRDRHQVAVMMFDYRGYGRSEGKPDEAGLLLDARAARQWLAERCQIKPEQIVLWGRSLGGGVMVDVAASEGCRGLILQSTFTSLVDTAQWHHPWLPVRRFMQTRFESLPKLERYAGPLLISHGDADEVVPYTMGRQLFESAPGKPKHFFTVPGGRHNDPEPGAYYRLLDRFLDELP